jgi:cell division protein FtsQ
VSERGGRRWRLVRATSVAIPSSVRRFNERRRAHRVRTARPWLIAAAVVALAGIGSWIVYGTSVFGVSYVRVIGSGQVGDDDVLRAAGILDGTPLASIDLGGIDSRVEKIVGVAHATATRDWPSTIVITVTPRIAVAAVPQSNAFVLVDKGGVVFRTAPSAQGLPVVVLATPGPTDPSTRSALSVLHSLPAGIRDQLIRITASSPASVTLELSGGRTVIWGDDSDNAAKGRVATSLLARPGTVIDVSAPTVVTVK